MVDRELQDDVEGITAMVMPMLRYAEAHAAARRGNATELKAWEGSRLMARVLDNDFDEAERDIAAAREE